MLKEIVIVFQSWSAAHQFIRQHKMWKWIVIPGIIYAALFIAGMMLFWDSADNAVYWASQQLQIEPWLQKERSEWLSFFFVMMGMMLRLTLFLLYFSWFKYLILTIGSPVFAYLSEKTEALLEGREHGFTWSDIRKDCARSIGLALRNGMWQTIYMLCLLILSLVPLIGWVTPLIALLMECYYFGFSMVDYSMARNRFSPAQSIRFIGTHRGLALGNGALFYIMHLVVIFAPAYAIIAATLSVHQVKNS